MAIIKIRNAAIDLDAAEIPNIDASKITSGTISSSRISGLPASAISSGTFADGPKSYHDGLCRDLKNKCRIRFQGPFMWVEGEGGISIDQFLKYRLDVDGRWSSAKEFYNYITYKSNENYEREALFLFHNEKLTKKNDFI